MEYRNRVIEALVRGAKLDAKYLPIIKSYLTLESLVDLYKASFEKDDYPSLFSILPHELLMLPNVYLELRDSLFAKLIAFIDSDFYFIFDSVSLPDKQLFQARLSSFYALFLPIFNSQDDSELQATVLGTSTFTKNLPSLFKQVIFCLLASKSTDALLL